MSTKLEINVEYFRDGLFPLEVVMEEVGKSVDRSLTTSRWAWLRLLSVMGCARSLHPNSPGLTFVHRNLFYEALALVEGALPEDLAAIEKPNRATVEILGNRVVFTTPRYTTLSIGWLSEKYQFAIKLEGDLTTWQQTKFAFALAECNVNGGAKLLAEKSATYADEWKKRSGNPDEN